MISCDKTQGIGWSFFLTKSFGRAPPQNGHDFPQQKRPSTTRLDKVFMEGRLVEQENETAFETKFPPGKCWTLDIFRALRWMSTLDTFFFKYPGWGEVDFDVFI